MPFPPAASCKFLDLPPGLVSPFSLKTLHWRVFRALEPSKPAKFAGASDEKCTRQSTTLIVRYFLKKAFPGAFGVFQGKVAFAQQMTEEVVLLEPLQLCNRPSGERPLPVSAKQCKHFLPKPPSPEPQAAPAGEGFWKYRTIQRHIWRCLFRQSSDAVFFDLPPGFHALSGTAAHIVRYFLY